MSKDKNSQYPFIQRFAEDLKLARKSERTVQSYCRALRKLSEQLGHDPNQASEEDRFRPHRLWLALLATRLSRELVESLMVESARGRVHQS